MYLMRYMKRLSQRPTYTFKMSNFFDERGKFSLDCDDLVNYRILRRLKPGNFAPRPAKSNKPRFINFTSVVANQNTNRG